MSVGMRDTGIAVIVPMKPFAMAKQRLRPAVRGKERIILARQMLIHVLSTVHASGIAGIGVLVSADAEVLALAAEYDFVQLYEIEAGYNKAASQAIAWVQKQGYDTVLLLPADLPILRESDLQAMSRQAVDKAPVMAIAPDTAGTGTNALLLRPPDLLTPSFGDDSFLRHISLAYEAGVEPSIYRSPTLAQDVDTPEDLWNLKAATLAGQVRNPARNT